MRHYKKYVTQGKQDMCQNIRSDQAGIYLYIRYPASYADDSYSP